MTDTPQGRWTEIGPYVLISRLEAAAIIGIDLPMLDALLESGRLRWYQVGGMRKIDLGDVRRLDHRLVLAGLEPVRRKRASSRQPIGARTRFDVLERDGFRCVYCGATPDEGRLVMDHVVPVIEGGPSTADNLVTACEPCNQGKGRRSLRIVG